MPNDVSPFVLFNGEAEEAINFYLPHLSAAGLNVLCDMASAAWALKAPSCMRHCLSQGRN